MTTPLQFFETSTREPFRRVRVPGSHRFGLDEPVATTPSIGDRISGRGYECGCRSIKDYDAKIGKKIGEDISDTLAKIIPAYGALRLVQKGLSEFFRRSLPFVGPRIADVIDDADPIKALLRLVGGKVDALLVESLFRNVPAWVPVLRNSQVARNFNEQEVQGLLVRSHQRCDGVPYSQWHRWYDWSFLVVPTGPSADMIGAGNRQRTANNDGVDQLKLDSRRYERHWMPPSSNIDFTLQCDWDLGTIDEPVIPSDRQDTQSQHGAFFNHGPLKRDWGWPMAGQYFWAGGRSVYDCRTCTSDDKAEGLHLNMLRPLRAIATARFEGFQFPENRAPVPAVRFTFFAANTPDFASTDPEDLRDRKKRTTGLFRYPELAEVDYEFVVQLPPGGEGVTSPDPHAIGALPDFSLNTIDIGRRLLANVDFEPFREGVHTPVGPQTPPEIIPIITEEGRAPTHVLLKVPVTKSRDQQNYGCIVTLGWHDPAETLAPSIFAVDIAFRDLEVHRDLDVVGRATWVMNFGANGRWFQRLFLVTPPSANSPTRNRIDNANFTVMLALADPVFVACHGMEEDLEGEEYKLPLDEDNPEVPPREASKSAWDNFLSSSIRSRKARLSKKVSIPTKVNDDGTVERVDADMPYIGDPIDWNTDVDQPLLTTSGNRTRDDNAKASEVARALFLRAAKYLFDGNDPVGLIDQNIFDPAQLFGRRRDGRDTRNPITVKEVIDRVGLGVPLQGELTGYATTRIGRMGMLGFEEDPRTFKDPDDTKDPEEVHDAKVDYILRYTITVRRLADPRPPAPPPPAPPPPSPPGSEPAIVPPSVNVRPVSAATVVPASVSVTPKLAASVVPASVSVTPKPAATVTPSSVQVRPIRAVVISPASVSVTIRNKP